MIRHLVSLALAAALCGNTTCTPQRASEPPPGEAGHGSAGAAAEVQCVDGWLSSKGLDEYGNAKGTMYMGGTPLFDEATGKATDRLEYIYQNHPEARAACRPGR